MNVFLFADAFMVVCELGEAYLALHFDDYSQKGQAFIISASVFLAGLWLVNTFTGNQNHLINAMILILSVAVIVVLNWHDHRKLKREKRKIKIMKMIPLQKQRHELNKQAGQRKREQRKNRGTGLEPN